MKRGRPKQFDDDEVLARAMQVFWRKGYDATSLDDLVEAMGIPRQSLYRTFTDKHTLFVRALQHYDQNVMSVILGVLSAKGPAIDNLRAVFEVWKRSINSPERMGCLMVNTSTQVPPDDSEVIKIIEENRKRGVAIFEKTLRRAQKEGDVDPSINPKVASRTICATVNGLLGMSRTGASDAFKKDVLASLPGLIGISSPA
ncbi:MAG: TetR/AcrR family transcriptional regulator [Pseudomonadales bacterium]